MAYYNGKKISAIYDGNTLKTTELLAKIYPVGSVYISTSNTSPASFLGGTWERIKDKFLLSSGDTYTSGATGGSANAVVVAHTHGTTIEGWSGNDPASASTISGYATIANNPNSVGGLQTKSAGESGIGKNMPPYLAVNMWKRTA